MPELPEVETVVRSLRPHLLGRRIQNAEFRAGRVLIGSAQKMAAAVAGQTIRGIDRYGKFIAMRLDRGVLTVHLGMTGRLQIDAPPAKWTHAILTLDRGVLTYEDSRQFGRIEYGPDVPHRVTKLGPEPLEITLDEFSRRLKARQAPVKAALLNQAVVRGVGNIYADEALFRAGIHPGRRASSLRKDRVERLYRSMREVLAEAIESRGSSVSNYVDGQGRKGGFQMLHRVYGRTGEPCAKCGAPIRKTTVAQRGTHYCGKCQK